MRLSQCPILDGFQLNTILNYLRNITRKEEAQFAINR